MIDKHKVVSLHYRLTRNNVDGELIEETFNSEPLTFIYGVGAMIPKFEQELTGLKLNDGFAFKVEAAEAYGEFDQAAVVDLSADIFKFEGKIDETSIFVGAIVPMKNADGHRIDGKVIELTDTIVKMDFNHPLAGQDLFFTGELVDLRDASAEEIAHGHVHHHGHHHHHEEGHQCTGNCANH
jgi:FKBP-type peptidyl-prolyl cis-trans isomerase SlyD